MASLLLASGLIVVATAVMWLGAEWLEQAAEELGRRYGLPAAIQGSVVIAIGSSFPELASAVLAALLHGAFELGVSIIVGSALFNVLVIPGLSVLASREMETNRELVFKEGLFYLVAVLTFLLLLALGRIYHPSSAGAMSGFITRPLALVALGLYGFYLVLQWLDTREHGHRRERGIDTPKAWGRALAGLVLILVSAEGLLRGIFMLSGTIAVPEFVWGLTVIAVATSLPDAFASITAARNDRSIASLGNVLGSNTFDLLVIVPLGVLLAGASLVDLTVTGPLMLLLAGATLLLIAFMRTGLVLTQREAVSLLAAYGLVLGAVFHIGGVVTLPV